MENIKSLNMERQYDNLHKKEKIISSERIAKRKKYLTIKKKIIVINICATIILIMMFIVGYAEMVGINSNKNVITAENKDYKIEINNLENIAKPYRSPERIRSLATSKLGMAFPKDEQIVKLENKGTSVEIRDSKAESTTQNPKTNIFSIFSNIFR